MDLHVKEIWMIYLVGVNLAGLTLMGIDKYKAKHHRWRIPEKTLFLVAACGGSVGSWAGMYLFSHKTRHRAFVLGMPLILVIQAVLFFCLENNYIP